ncbi:AAA domain-containing protein [Nitriliruptoraceae bacterium ZYF776]|nr:AAA domain-containing protein [Profundirhabdus halotolerans]
MSDRRPPLRAAEVARRLQPALAEVERVIVGQRRVLERIVTCLVAGGHVLLEGVPGVGKTLTIATLSKVLGGSFQRIQFTADLLPADIVGTRIYRGSSETFTFEPGPVFANFVLADEINRAPAKVQSALLEVMGERQVTVAGQTMAVPRPFLVLATQNPIENEGVFPLPEAQRDRFMMRVEVPLPAADEETEIVRRSNAPAPGVRQLLELDELEGVTASLPQVRLPEEVHDYALRLVMTTRDPAGYGVSELAPIIAAGASPRASIALDRGSRALALVRGRDEVTAQEVYDIAYDVLNHRVGVTFDALAAGVRPNDAVAQLLRSVPAPAPAGVGRG